MNCPNTLRWVPLLTIVAAAGAFAETPEGFTTSIKGRVAMPEKLPVGVKADDLSVDQAIVVLEGKCPHPRRPYPEDWKSKTVDERRQWSSAFDNSAEGETYRHKVEAAIAARFRKKVPINADGSFVITDIKPAWYQLTAVIMHPSGKGQHSYELARGHSMRQFFVKEKPANTGVMVLELKNVLAAGDTAPEWTAADYADGKFSLSDYRGKFVLFDVWATWCGPCLAEIPNLEKVHEEFGSEEFSVVGLSIDETLDLPQAFLKAEPSAYHQGFLGSGAAYEAVATAYGITTVPSIWLVGPDGKILARGLRGKAVSEAVRKALAGDSPPD